MDIATLTLAGRLIFDVAKWIAKLTSEAELSSQIPKEKKHEFVEQGVNNKINNYDTGRFSELPLQAIANAKNEAKKHVSRIIKDTVSVKHATGEFVKE